nr:primosomal protein N' [Maliibacterium massiliense]
MPYARVIVDIAASAIDREFDYAVPKDYPVDAVPGLRVQVPFGPRHIEGFIVALSDTTAVPQEKIRPLGRPLEERPAILPHLMDLALWMRRRYRCLLVEALRLLIPAEMRKGRVRAKQRNQISLAVLPQDARARAEALPARFARQKQLLALLAGGADDAQVRRAMPDAMPVARALEKRGLVRIGSVRALRTPYRALEMGQDAQHVLTAEQQIAAEAIFRGMDAERGAFLLHGVTGSGKTEVYMRAVAHALEAGRSAIVLVPEIALTPQMVQRFRARFGNRAAVLHSGLSQGERFDEWQRIRAGEVSVAVGARSCVFAPFANVGLIVVDEEHETSYRAENAPRYDAVEVAERRCAAEGATLVLGSATPSVARYYRALHGDYTVLHLDHRVEDRPMPQVQVVDMRRELAAHNKSMFSRPLQQAMAETLARGEQMILFLNRRGFATFVSCRKCGEAMTCPNCDVAMTYHSAEKTLKCHYCGAQLPVPDACPACGSKAIRYFGAGTQKVEQQLAALFPEAKLLRMDRDTTARKDAHLHILKRFAAGEAQILLGTQMVAKGLDFPNVTLVGVMAADTTLHYPDYASAERTFQLIAQVAGRAGRDVKAGRVVVQTYAPDEPPIALAARHDYQTFYAREIMQRQAGQFPPFGRFVRFLVVSAQQQRAAGQARALCKEIARVVAHDTHLASQVLLLAWMPAMLSRLEGRFRYQVLLKMLPDARNDALIDAAHACLNDALFDGCSITMEVDAQHMV